LKKKTFYPPRPELSVDQALEPLIEKPPRRVRAIYREIKRRLGDVREHWYYMAHMPSILESRWKELKALLDSPLIPERTLWMIAYQVGLADGCPTCKANLRGVLVGLGLTEGQIGAIEKDIGGAGLDEATKQVLIYAAACAREPHAIEKETIDAFLKVGLSPMHILQVAAVTSYFKGVIQFQHSLALHQHEPPDRPSTAEPT
jgi:hypothetical protein